MVEPDSRAENPDDDDPPHDQHPGPPAGPEVIGVRPAQREPFRVRPVELVMLEQRWLALWNAVEIGELPIEEWRSLAATLAVTDPAGRRWRVAEGSQPGSMRFAASTPGGDRHIDDSEWPWPTRAAARTEAARREAARRPLLAAPPALFGLRPPGALPPLPVQSPRDRMPQTGYPVLGGSGDDFLPPSPRVDRLKALRSRWVPPAGPPGAAARRSLTGAALAGLLLLWAFSAGSTDQQPESAPALAAGALFPAPPGAAAPALLPSRTGALTPGSFDWESVTCFSGEAWDGVGRLVGTQVPCAGRHLVATAVLPYPAGPTDPLGACAAASALLEPAGSRQAASGQWVDADGGLLICTMAATDPADTGPVIP